MSAQPNISIRAAIASEDLAIAEHFYHMWRDNDVAADVIQANWQETTLAFIQQARQTLSYAAFVATVGDQIVGSVSCQLFAGLYPLILQEQQRKYGYIWGVYVEAPYRGQGIATQLMDAALEHLRSIGCTRVVLHASPSGKPVYTRMGFTDSNEMRLDLI